MDEPSTEFFMVLLFPDEYQVVQCNQL